jgi:hypothetical protein
MSFYNGHPNAPIITLGLSELTMQAPHITAPSGKLTPSVQALKLDMSSPSGITTLIV